MDTRRAHRISSERALSGLIGISCFIPSGGKYAMETVTNTGMPRVDVHLGKFSQACVVILTGLAFLFNQPLLVALAAILMVLAAWVPAASPFKFLYQRVV